MSEVGDVIKAVGASGVLASLGPWGIILSAAAQFGTDFVTGIFENAKNDVDPTPEEWEKLKAKISTPFKEL